MEENTVKSFDEWNEEKIFADSHVLSYDFFYHPREIWWCAVGINIGVEVDGKHDHFERPILIVKKFNVDMFWGIPLTTTERVNEFYQKVTHGNRESWAMLSQMRTLSTKRLLRKFGRIPESEFILIQDKLRNLI